MTPSEYVQAEREVFRRDLDEFIKQIRPNLRNDEILTAFVNTCDKTAAGAEFLFAEIGLRFFRKFVIAGLDHARHVKEDDTDLARNATDLLLGESLIIHLMDACLATPYIPANVGPLLARIANALDDVRENRRPALFQIADEPQKEDHTARARTEGQLAAALDILVQGGLKLGGAKVWLDETMRKSGIVDTAGNVVRAERVAQWRGNFRRGMGAAGALIAFESWRGMRDIIAAPASEQKLDQCKFWARGIIRRIATRSNRTVAPGKN